MYFNEKDRKATGGNIENIVLKNITYNGSIPNPSLIKGYISDRVLKDVLIKNIRINGKQILKPDWYIKLGAFIKHIKFKK